MISLAGVAAAAAAVLAFSGCAPTASVASTTVTTPEPVATQAQPSDDRPYNSTGEYICGVSAVSATGSEDRYIGYAVPTLVDGGPRVGATGVAAYDADGQPVAYAVAPGDNFESVELRFCTPGFYLEFVNSVRRGSLDLFAGDTLNLSAYTITSVGDVNGAVNDNPLWRDGEAQMPPQR